LSVGDGEVVCGSVGVFKVLRISIGVFFSMKRKMLKR